MNTTKMISSFAAPPAWLEGVNPQVHEVWHGRWKPGAIEPARRLIDHELVIFDQGPCEMELAGARTLCPPGSFIIIPPGLLHSTRAGPSTVHRYCAHFDWTISRPMPTIRLWSFAPENYNPRHARPAPPYIPSGLLRGPCDKTSRLTALMRTLREQWHGPPSDRATCRPLLLEILLRLFAVATAHPTPPQMSDLAAQARAALDDLSHNQRGDSITKAFESLGYSYAYLCRQFTAKYGLSPLRYLTHTRMEKAKAMLHQNTRKVRAIATELGYEDTGYFIRIFRQYTGATPGQFARKFEGISSGRQD